MDATLIEKAPELITLVTEAVKNYGSEDVEREPIYCIYGYPSQRKVDSEVEYYRAQWEAVLEFAGTWDIDLDEWNFETDEDRFLFAIQYLCMDFDTDSLPENETLEEYCQSILEWIDPSLKEETETITFETTTEENALALAL